MVDRKKILIIGASGYIGAYLKMNLPIDPIDLLCPSKSQCNFLNEESIFEYFKSLKGYQLSIIFCAVVPKTPLNNFQSYLDNIFMLNNFIKNIGLLDVKKIIFFSTADVYGSSPKLPINESTALQPDSWYALSKFTSEWIISHTDQIKCPLIIMRIPGIYGIGHGEKSIIQNMIKSAILKKKIYVSNSGSMMRDYVYIGDLTRLVHIFITRDFDGIVNIATSKSISIIKVAQTIIHLLSLDAKIENFYTKDTRDFNLIFETQKLKEFAPDFKFLPLEVTLKEYKNYTTT